MNGSTTTRVSVAERAAKAGAAVAMETFRTDIEIETKRGKTDPVTEADRDAQRRVFEIIERAYPGETLVGEEADARSDLPNRGVAWIVDPIDGTTNYVRGNPQWTTSVGVVRNERPIAAAHVMPAIGDVYVAESNGLRVNGDPATVSDRDDPETFIVAAMMGWGWRRGLENRAGIAAICGAIGDRFGHLRRFGTGQTTLSMVAAGEIDGALTLSEGDPWDRVAGAHLIKQADGIVTNLDGDRWTPDSSGMVVSNGLAHDEFLDVAREIRERTGTAGSL